MYKQSRGASADATPDHVAMMSVSIVKDRIAKRFMVKPLGRQRNAPLQKSGREDVPQLMQRGLSDLLPTELKESSRRRAVPLARSLARRDGGRQPMCFWRKSTVRCHASSALFGSYLEESVERMKAWPAS